MPAPSLIVALGADRARGADFADAVIVQLGKRSGCVETVTFDGRAAAAVNMRLIADDARSFARLNEKGRVPFAVAGLGHAPPSPTDTVCPALPADHCADLER